MRLAQTPAAAREGGGTDPAADVFARAKAALLAGRDAVAEVREDLELFVAIEHVLGDYTIRADVSEWVRSRSDGGGIESAWPIVYVYNSKNDIVVPCIMASP